MPANPANERPRGRLSVVLVVFAVVAALGALPAQAAPYNCPSGWNSVTSNPINHVSLFCYLPNSGGPIWNDDVHAVKVNANAVGQYTRFASNPGDIYGAYGSSGNPNPLFLKKPVGEHLDDYAFTGIDIVINGTFFDCTESCPTESALSFPTFRAGPLVNAGSDTSVDRACIAWNGAPPETYDWNNASTVWSNVDAAHTDCGWAYHHVVGLDATFDLGKQAHTYVGYDLSASPDELCFVVGGDQTTADMLNILEMLDCEGAIQMDGGSSSQLSYLDPDTGVRHDPVNGPLTNSYRKVPHYFVIWG